MSQKKLPKRFKGATFNPLDLIGDHNSKLALDDCDAISEALVPIKDVMQPHWPQTARQHISAVTAVTAEYGQPGHRSLQDVLRILSHPNRLQTAISLAQQSTAWGGKLADRGAQLLHFQGNERSSVLTSAIKELLFLATPTIADNTRSSSFNPANLKRVRRPMTVYLILPPEFMKPQIGLLRMWVGSLFRAVVREGASERKKVWAVLDETAALGADFEPLETALSQYRKYGLRVQTYWQSAGQLRMSFPKDGGQTLMSNSVPIFFGTRDIETARMLITPMLGTQTIMIAEESQSKSHGGSSGWSEGRDMSKSGGTNWGSSSSVSHRQLPRELLKPDEVLRLPPRLAISFPGGGCDPVPTELTPYFLEPKLFRRQGLLGRFRAALRTLLGSALFLGISVWLLVTIGRALDAHLKAQQSMPDYRQVPVKRR